MDFVRFSFAHWMALCSFFIAGVCILISLRSFPLLTRRWVIGSMCSIGFIFNITTKIDLVGCSNWQLYIPLEFCSLVELLCIIACITQSRFLYAFVYFCGITACLQGLITPALHLDAPHPVFFAFFLSHSFIVIAALAMPLCLNWRSQSWDYVKVQIAACIYIACVIPVNLALETNYCFTRMLPPDGSILDFLGESPYHLIIAQVPISICFYFLSRLVREKKVPGSENEHDGSVA